MSVLGRLDCSSGLDWAPSCVWCVSDQLGGSESGVWLTTSWGTWLSSMRSFMLQRASPGSFTWKLSRIPKRVKFFKFSSLALKEVFRCRIRTGTVLLLLQFIGQSRSSGQPRLKRWGERLQLLMGEALESHCKGEWVVRRD